MPTRACVAVWIEVLQGEGGIQVADIEYVRGLRRMATSAAGC